MTVLMSESIYLKDPWPVMPDGTDFDGSGLLSLLRNGKSPFAGAWDVNLLIQEIENSPNQKAARIRAALFDFNPSIDFCSAWYLKCLDDHKPASFAIPVAPTREFCISVFTSKIEATIKDIGDMIGWEGDNVTVGPVAFAAKQSLLSLIPYILPADDKDGHLYRLVLEHGDFGYHNMTTTFKDTLDGQPLVTSVYDWEFGSIAPTILSQPAMKIRMDFDLDEDVNPIVSGMIDNATQEDVDLNLSWAKQYYEVFTLSKVSYAAK
ncbi:hypothetical protein H0H93_005286 [Arthromyces matolae]|nr:hypothetical protein H0H93_005286 [Arthromyces matolae]